MGKKVKKWDAPKFNRKGLTRWNWMCQHRENLKLGRSVDIGAFSYVNAEHGVVIEDFAQIGSHVSIYSISTIDRKKGRIMIGRNTRIGTHSVIMPGVTIGENSIIGALSFVNKNIPPNTLAYGIPVKVIRKLREDEIRVGES